MLETILDSEIFIDFCKSRPTPDPYGPEKEFDEHESFWKFLKFRTNLKLMLNGNFNGQIAENRFITRLSSGRGEAKIDFLEKFNWPHKGILPGNTFPGSFFCLKQDDLSKKNQITSRNGMFFGFDDDYLQQWQKLSFSGKEHLTFHVRKELEGKMFLKGWDDLSQYILPFTDIIISDRFINDISVRDQNLLEFICFLDRQTPVSYNLLIITQKGDKDFLNEFEKYLTDKIKENKLKAKLGIVLTRREHDRCILMNYLKIESGDSFNYFNRDGRIITNGTELKLFPLCSPDNFYDTRVKLSVLKNIAENEKEDIRGNLNNRLFRYCDD
ncbi:MAG: hypothetical protein RBS73_04095 [Prolixibacteraceae bacterium]|jgi:hypothetical protein|nr:hypothetical protein [Prolixibacteraceae bacterium]